MAIYKSDGNKLTLPYDAVGNALHTAYDANGDVVYTDSPYSPALTFIHSIPMSEFNPNTTISPQGMAIYGNKIFQYFTGDDSLAIIDIDDWTIVGRYALPEFVHGNGLMFGNVIQSSGYPLLYGSQFGLSVSEESRKIAIADVDLSSYSIIGYYDIPASAGYHPQFVADWANGTAYTIGYSNLYTTSGDMIISAFDLSDMTTPTEQWTIPYCGVVQGTTFWNGNIIIIGDSYNYADIRLTFVDVLSHTKSEYLLTKKQSSSMEFQGVDVFDGNLMVSCWIYDNEDSRKLKYWLYSINLPID